MRFKFPELYSLFMRKPCVSGEVSLMTTMIKLYV